MSGSGHEYKGPDLVLYSKAVAPFTKPEALAVLKAASAWVHSTSGAELTRNATALKLAVEAYEKTSL